MSNDLMILNFIFASIIGYLFGCLQFSYLIAKVFKKIDIREHGNGNAGASNTTMVLGWKYGIIVALLDISKAIVSVSVVSFIFGHAMNSDTLNIIKYLTGMFTIIGHNYPFYMDFKGGKGTASLIGLLLALDWRMALIGILSIVLITIITDYIALGTIVMMISFVICTFLFKYNIYTLYSSIFLTLLSVYKHLPNIKRIINGTETGLRKVTKK